MNLNTSTLGRPKIGEGCCLHALLVLLLFLGASHSGTQDAGLHRLSLVGCTRALLMFLSSSEPNEKNKWNALHSSSCCLQMNMNDHTQESTKTNTTESQERTLDPCSSFFPCLAYYTVDPWYKSNCIGRKNGKKYCQWAKMWACKEENG